MPEFEVVPIGEAMMSANATGKRSQIAQEYAGYIGRVRANEAGRLTPSDGETVATVRRRLGSAAKASGRSIQIRRVGTDIYFWEVAPKRQATQKSHALTQCDRSTHRIRRAAQYSGG